MIDGDTNIFSNLAGANSRLEYVVGKTKDLWQRGANKRTKIIVICVLIISGLFYLYAVKPPSNFPINTLIAVKEDQNLEQVAQDLVERHVVRNKAAMILITRLYKKDKSIFSGDYLFKKSENLFGVIRRLSTGEFGLEPVKIRVKEGSTVEDIANVLSKKMLKFNKELFLRMASKNEGYLFPDTYYFLPNAPESQIVDSMKDNFYKHYKEIEDQVKDTQYSVHDIVTLASIVELEAHKFEDRRKIAGVLYNRLKLGMPLQVDVSFVYIMGKGTFDITKEDLKHDSLYNTYVHKGLPPGPIGSPSMDSLKAVVNPVKSKWLFYLADKRGVTHYSSTYKEHLRKKRLYIDNRN